MNELFLPMLKHIVPQIELLVVIVLIDFLVGVAASLKNHEFDVKKLPEFLEVYGLRMLGWLGLEFLAVIPEEYLVPAGITQAIGDGAMMLIIASVLGSIIKSAGELGIMPNLTKIKA